MMEQGMQALQEKIFNLQLTVQKQEEELRMYRNGTTANELFELIHEKDIEIETWRAKCDEKDEKLKRLAKTSGDVLLRYERLQDELQEMRASNQGLEDSVKRALEIKAQSEARLREMEEELAAGRKELAARDDQIGALRLQIWESEQKLDAQSNSANNAQISVLEAETEIKQLKEYQRDLEAVISDQTQEIADLTAEVKKWKQFVADQDSSVEKLQKRCAALVAEKADTLRNLDLERQEMITHVQNFRESMSSNLAQRDEALKRREDKIRELQFQISVLQQELKMKSLSAASVGGASSSHANHSSSSGMATTGGKKVLGERTNTLSSVPASAMGLTKPSKLVEGNEASAVDSVQPPSGAV